MNKFQICGWCTNWRCDDPIHLTGHCIINRLNVFHGTRCKTCKKFKDVREDINNGKKETT